MTLTWTEIDARWPDAGVMWDARVSPLVDWDPLFRARGDQLWADDPRCSDLGHGRCRCLCWWREQWTTVAHHGALALLNERLMGAALKYPDPQCMYVNPETYRQLVARLPPAPSRRILRGSRAERKRRRAASLLGL